ncbi:hypothetical protein DFQ26_003171 [Actinomortierella ambigua]|nr:hypothetical protein DFQ26_003171 [Actinomortierella ambigua]
MPHDSPLLNSTSLSTSTSDLINPSTLQPWGIKARWDYKQHFLDENTVTPKDEFAHKHHRLRTSSNASAVSSSSPSAAAVGASGGLSTLPSGVVPKGAAVANFRSNGSSSGRSSPVSSTTSRKRNSSQTAHHHHQPSTGSAMLTGGSGGGNNAGAKGGNGINTLDEYHPQANFWSTGTTRHTDDGGYSSSSSCVSAYSSTSSSLPIQHPRGSSVPPPPPGQSTFSTNGTAGSSSSTLLCHQSHPPYPYGSGIECFATLQPLEYEPEPLLSEKTIHGIVQAGKTVVLTREYSVSLSSLRERLFAAARRHGRTGLKEDEGAEHDDDNDYDDEDGGDGDKGTGRDDGDDDSDQAADKRQTQEQRHQENG